MAVIDLCRFLKMENPSEGGVEVDYLPTEADPSEDYGNVKGIVFDSVTGNRIQGVSGVQFFYDTAVNNTSGWTLTDLSQKLFGRKVANKDPSVNQALIWDTTSGWTPKAIDSSISRSASPGFTWGKSGNIGPGTYMDNDTVPSNLAGRMVPIVSGYLSEVFVSNEDNNTFTIVAQKRTGSTFTDLATISLTNQRTKVQSVSGALVLYGDEIAVKIGTGSAKNPVVGIVILGNLS